MLAAEKMAHATTEEEASSPRDVRTGLIIMLLGDQILP